MSYKLIGAVLIIVGCGGFGFMIAAAHKSEERYLTQLYRVLDFISSELSYHAPPLSDLLRDASTYASGILAVFFNNAATEMDRQISPDAQACIASALEKTDGIPVLTSKMLRLLGHSLGRFDLNGQLSNITLVSNACQKNLNRLSKDRAIRLRSYRTLGICAGVAIAILLV